MPRVRLSVLPSKETASKKSLHRLETANNTTAVPHINNNYTNNSGITQRRSRWCTSPRREFSFASRKTRETREKNEGLVLIRFLSCSKSALHARNTAEAFGNETHTHHGTDDIITESVHPKIKLALGLPLPNSRHDRVLVRVSRIADQTLHRLSSTRRGCGGNHPGRRAQGGATTSDGKMENAISTEQEQFGHSIFAGCQPSKL